MQRIATFVTLGLILIFPLVVSAQLVPQDCAQEAAACDFAALITLARNILTFIVTTSIVVSAIMFAYAGWLFLSDAGSTSKISDGKKIFSSVAIGLVIVLIAWLVVNTLLEVLTGKGIEERESDARTTTVDIQRIIG